MGEFEYGIEMTDAEMAAFLTRQGHGVLSFGGDQPYGLPVSFGYDVVEHRCIFQLVFGPDSKKRAYVDDSPAVTLVAYEWVDVDDWRSVLVDGRLEPLEDGPAVVEAADVFAEYGSVVGLTVFDRPVADLDPEWYELRIETTSGYQSPVVDDRDGD